MCQNDFWYFYGRLLFSFTSAVYIKCVSTGPDKDVSEVDLDLVAGLVPNPVRSDRRVSTVWSRPARVGTHRVSSDSSYLANV